MTATVQAITPRAIALPPSPDPAHDPAAVARRILRTTRMASVATIDAGSGYPFASAVNLATDMDGAPLMLISMVALHTRNLLADSRLSIMPMPKASPGPSTTRAASERLTVAGRATRTDDARARRRFLACHPKMTLPSMLPGFCFWRLEPTGVDLISVGRPLTPADLLTDLSDAGALVLAEEALIDEINADAGLVRRLARAAEALDDGPWSVTGLDPEGVNLRSGGHAIRLTLADRVTSRADMVAALRRV